ncbi:hypothetical protein BDZ45DRAFT_746884 [Acephala macrosclerotiorum]|nr:hypothetical protein BDZ45DRAFT_746884 [Acephala macrosclerotiorum]
MGQNQQVPSSHNAEYLTSLMGSLCITDNVLRAFCGEGEVGVLDCQYLLSIPQPNFVITETIYLTETFLSKRKTVRSSGTVTAIASEVFSAITEYTTTFVPYLSIYASQHLEAHISSTCSCISQPVIPSADYSLVYLLSAQKQRAPLSATLHSSVTTTHPAICYTSFLALNFATANPQRPVTTVTPSPGTPTSDESCCMSCFHAKNCLHWSNNLRAECKIVVEITKVTDLISNICPLGIQNEGGLSKPGATTMAYNPGPCFGGDSRYLFAAPSD